jgi:hypothetical protein
MARKAEATLWVLVKIGKRSIMKRVVKKGRGYVPKVEGPYEPGSYYLRYTQNAKRRVESVGNDLTIALQEKRARQQALDASTELVVPPVPPRKTLREHISQFRAKKDGLTKTERRRANAWRSFLIWISCQSNPWCWSSTL